MFRIYEKGITYELPYRPAGTTVCSGVEFLLAKDNDYLVTSEEAAQVGDIITWLCDTHCADYCSEYGEPGYHSPEAGIIFANWNDIPREFQDILEEAGYELEWSDEWYIDHDNSKAWRTNADSHEWECSIQFTDNDDVLTPDDDITEWIEWAIDDSSRCLPSWCKVEEAGFTVWNDEPFEHGWHPGQTDTPEQVVANLPDGVEYVFRKVENSQFYIKFEVLVRQP